MSVVPIANQHSVFSSYGAVHMQRQLIPSAALHSSELGMAAQQAAAAMANKDSVHQQHSVAATNTENRSHKFDKHAPHSGSTAAGAGGAGGSGTRDADAPDTARNQARADLPLGAEVDVYL
ncbi:hypothetical protein [Kineosporia babensis]|uniref:Uncharacterized protein n=1 Tax=Kineosporia babensis TaxID=499548 RepID=A0A9X1NI84_9ACTN|nr:hypothetical protein [Kineosporia babensis]MCD5314540.1 hypothetical protein [Kineosporia babensis]